MDFSGLISLRYRLVINRHCRVRTENVFSSQPRQVRLTQIIKIQSKLAENHELVCLLSGSFDEIE